MLRLKAYSYRLQPTPTQLAELAAWSGALRFLWNWMLAQRSDSYKASEGRVKVGYGEQAAQLPAMKEMFPWMGLVPSQVLPADAHGPGPCLCELLRGTGPIPALQAQVGLRPGPSLAAGSRG